MRVLLWATTLQADILALAYHLDQRPGCELLVVTEHVRSFLASPIAQRRPLSAPVLDRAAPEVEARVLRFSPDVVVCDNHFPHFDAAPRVCAMWHGLGWKARSSSELPAFFKHVKRLTGQDPCEPSSHFLAQCYHERDQAWRTEQWGLSPQNCAVTGSCFADLLRGGVPYERAELEREYGLDLSRKTVLLNITWHFGRIFPGSWQPRLVGTDAFERDLDFLRALIARIQRSDANVLFCLHDRKRYEGDYLAAIYGLLAEFGDGVCVRHKDQHPDNWADLCVADVMVSNMSSFSTFFYHTGKPVVHLCPPPEAGEVSFAQYSWLGLHRRLRKSSMPSWMNDPLDNGGLSASSPEQALQALHVALTEPECCRARAGRWLGEHVAFPEPSASDCLGNAIQKLCEAS